MSKRTSCKSRRPIYQVDFIPMKLSDEVQRMFHEHLKDLTIDEEDRMRIPVDNSHTGDELSTVQKATRGTKQNRKRRKYATSSQNNKTGNKRRSNAKSTRDTKKIGKERWQEDS